ncbi:CMRF35-like molecule 1 isoform X2 [Zootoca vivipara]|uniref:CMRF35-like molecule 1 isoform X2 n=1 Tax=Zootoca vivipara TaxID=8524 RepID=UPI00158FF5D4|nr:CMRF35-like molecule 1 isoform X2 [Zootoca vivipara]
MVSMRQWHFIVGMLFFNLKGCMSDLTGPEALSGFLGRSLSVICKYDVGFKKHVKYWCKGSPWSYCTIVVRTTGSEEEKMASRIFIKDNHAGLEFTVRLENLKEQDAGIYWCGIERTGSDYGFPVNITVLPEPLTTTTTAAAAVTTRGPDSDSEPPGLFITILLPVIFLVLVLLLVAALLLMRSLKKQKAAKACGDILLSTAPNHAEGNTSGRTVKLQQRPHHKTAPPSSHQATNHTEEVEYATVMKASTSASQPEVPTATEQVSYASLSFQDPVEEATYANV